MGMRRARVRFTADTPVRNVDPGSTYIYRAGDEVTMVQWDRKPGLPPATSSWWSDFDIDGAYIVDADRVEVIAVLKERAD
jgi:hypothetical protein